MFPYPNQMLHMRPPREPFHAHVPLRHIYGQGAHYAGPGVPMLDPLYAEQFEHVVQQMASLEREHSEAKQALEEAQKRFQALEERMREAEWQKMMLRAGFYGGY